MKRYFYPHSSRSRKPACAWPWPKKFGYMLGLELILHVLVTPCFGLFKEHFTSLSLLVVGEELLRINRQNREVRLVSTCLHSDLAGEVGGCVQSFIRAI